MMQMTDQEKRDKIRKWFNRNEKQLRINVWKICGKQDHVVEKWGNDLLPYFVEGFLKRPIDDQWAIFSGGKFENYVTRGMAIALKSSTSTFYHQYRKKAMAFRELHHEYDYGLYHENEEEKKEANRVLVQEVLGELNFYDRYLLSKYYIEEMSLKEICEVVGINQSTISKDIRSALKNMRKILLEKNIEL